MKALSTILSVLKKLSAEHRLAAYYNAYRIRLIDCLATDFKGLQQAVGDEAFEYLVLDYLKLYPSKHPSVRWLGRHMVEFLSHSEYENREFLAELADFEWTQGLCFDGSDLPEPIDISIMESISPEQWPLLKFEFHPVMYWKDFYFNAAPFWVAIDNAENPPEVIRDQHPTRWLMWRQERRPHWRSLEVTEAWVIEAAYHGANFADLCEGLLEWIDPDSVAITAAGYLKQWLSDGLLIKLNI